MPCWNLINIYVLKNGCEKFSLPEFSQLNEEKMHLFVALEIDSDITAGDYVTKVGQRGVCVMCASLQLNEVIYHEWNFVTALGVWNFIK